MSSSTMVRSTPIQNHYKNSVIFITGGTGFLGTTLVEKLLRSCAGIKKIYLLIRSKKQKTADQRLVEYFDGPFWELLKSLRPNAADYVSLIHGDMINEDLSISSQDYEKLINEVNIIYHAAATVRFDESIKYAAQINIKATKNILQLAEKCHHLKSFVHISTAYVQCLQPELHEIFYEPARDPEEFLSFCDKHTKEELDTLTPSIIGKFPNTYSFTKNLTEQIVRKYDKVLPIAIARPSIVMGIHEEPIRGWVSNLFGPLGLMVGIAMGLVRVLKIDKYVTTDVVPGDYCINFLIAIPPETSKYDYRKTGIKIYNYGSGKDNPLRWIEFFYWAEEFAHIYACIHPSMYLGFYFVILTTSDFVLKVCQFLFHLTPAFAIDTWSRLRGRESKIFKLCQRIHKLSALTHFFSTRQWTFHNDNTKQLSAAMDALDQVTFPFDITRIEWDVFFLRIVKSISLYILKRPLSTVPDYDRQIYKMKLIRNTVVFSVLLISFIVWWKFI